MGGDFNCTWDPRCNLDNLDTLNMVQIPSKVRSERINQIGITLKLHDPFRVFSPVAREFTYVPNAHRNINRSRIDFFLCSEELTNVLQKCWIEPSVISSLFDHKMVRLSTTKEKKIINRSVIKDSIIKNKLVKIGTDIAAMDTHLNHAGPMLPGHIRRQVAEQLGMCFYYLEQIQTEQRKKFL
jgi:hypothetical protein